MNKVFLIGYIAKKPKIVEFKDGNKLAKFRLATSRKWKDKTSGEVKEKIEWHDLVSTNTKQAEVLEKYVDKGSRLHVEGSIEYGNYTDKEDVKRYTTVIKAVQFTFLNNASNSSEKTNDKTVKDDGKDDLPF